MTLNEHLQELAQTVRLKRHIAIELQAEFVRRNRAFQVSLEEELQPVRRDRGKELDEARKATREAGAAYERALSTLHALIPVEHLLDLLDPPRTP